MQTSGVGKVELSITGLVYRARRGNLEWLACSFHSHVKRELAAVAFLQYAYSTPLLGACFNAVTTKRLMPCSRVPVVKFPCPCSNSCFILT